MVQDQELILMPFNAGGNIYGYGSMLVCPKSSARSLHFALAHLQGFVNAAECEGYKPRSIVYVAPPFRHTHFEGKQVVVHNRMDDCHEVFSYNLYPGPSAKKGVYSVLLDIGEQEGWVTAHASCGRLVTPYENEMVIMQRGRIRRRQERDAAGHRPRPRGPRAAVHQHGNRRGNLYQHGRYLLDRAGVR